MGILGYIKKLKDDAEAKRIAQEKAAAALRQRIKDEEEQYRKSLENSPIIDGLFSEFNKQPWILHRQSGKDSGMRELRITSDTVEIKWSRWHTESIVVGQDKWGIDEYKGRHVEEIYGHAVFSFTKSGYRSLGEYDFEKKRALLDVITARIKKQVPGTHADSDYGYGGYSDHSIHRHYHLPEPQNTIF